MIRPLLAAAAAIALLATACSSSSGDGAPLMLAEVYAEVDDLDTDARRTRLVELATDEGSRIRIYTQINLDDSGAINDAFTAATGVEVELFRANSGDVLQRVLEEADADVVGFDVVILSAPEMLIIDDAGVLDALRSPGTDDILASTVNPNWSGMYLNVFTPAWNTELVDPEDAPTTWEDVLLGTEPGALGFELGDFDWFTTLVRDHFVAQLGYSEEDAVAIVRQAAQGARAIDGHTVMTELLGAGEFDVVTSAFQHSVDRIAADGSPIAWQPPVEPLIVRPSGVGIRADASAPAGALLFVDWVLSPEGQAVLASRFRTPAHVDVEGGLPPGTDVLTVDVEALAEIREEWEALYLEILQGS